MAGRLRAVPAGDRGDRRQAIRELAAEQRGHAAAVGDAGRIDAGGVDAGRVLHAVERRSQEGDIVRPARHVAVHVPERLGPGGGRVGDEEVFTVRERAVGRVASELRSRLPRAAQCDDQRPRGRRPARRHVQEDGALARVGRDRQRVVAGRERPAGLRMSRSWAFIRRPDEQQADDDRGRDRG